MSGLHTTSTRPLSGLQGAAVDWAAMIAIDAPADPQQLIVITQDKGRHKSGYREWNGTWHYCGDHDHLTRADALSCAEERLRYRA